MCAHVYVLCFKLYLTLCDLVDCNLAGSSVHGISQARILEQGAISFSRGFPNPGIKPASPALAGRFCTIEPPEKPLAIVHGIAEELDMI